MSRLLRTTTKNGDRTIYQNNGIEAKISKGGTRNALTMDSGEIRPLPIRVSLHGQTSLMGTTIRKMEDHMINA